MTHFFKKYVFAFGLFFLVVATLQANTPYDKTLRVVEALKGSNIKKAKEFARGDVFLEHLSLWYEALNIDINHPDALLVIGKALGFAQHFPHHGRLEKRGEKAVIAKFEDNLKHPYILKWFGHTKPYSYAGLKLYIAALLMHKNTRQAQEAARTYWHKMKLEGPQELEFLRLYPKMLSENDIVSVISEHIHHKRFDRAEKLMPFVNKAHGVYFKTLKALYQVSDNADVLLMHLPKHYHQTYGLLKASLHYYKKKDNVDAVLHLLKTTKLTPQTHKSLVGARKFCAREKIRAKDYLAAYRIAAGHSFAPGIDKAEFDWLAGFIALRFLNKPQEALTKFAHLYGEVGAPISKARMAYWSGRALDALKQKGKGAEWYKKASLYGATFYGQLAAKNLGKAPTFAMLKQIPLRAEFDRYLKVGQAFLSLGDSDYSSMFLKYLAKQDLSLSEKATLAQNAEQKFHLLDVSAALGKAAMGKTNQVVKEHYATIPYGLSYDDAALVHAVILHESVFDAGVVSGADDSGLMQLIPPTAMHVAKLFNVPYRQAWLTGKPDYNVKLGSLHLKELDGLTGGCYPMMAAGYNAGIKKVNDWVAAYGDPRKNQIDIVDWIELISYEGTRNYVQRVMEKVYMYRMLYPKFVGSNKGPGKFLTRWVLF